MSRDQRFEILETPQLTPADPLVIATDGGYYDGIHSSAFVATDGSWGVTTTTYEDDVCRPSCSNATELNALKLGLEGRDVNAQAIIVTDSQLVCQYMRKWRQGSKDMPWWASSEPYQQLRSRITASGHNLTVKQVKGHNGHVLNEVADGLASIGLAHLRRGYDRQEAGEYCTTLVAGLFASLETIV